MEYQIKTAGVFTDHQGIKDAKNALKSSIQLSPKSDRGDQGDVLRMGDDGGAQWVPPLFETDPIQCTTLVCTEAKFIFNGYDLYLQWHG